MVMITPAPLQGLPPEKAEEGRLYTYPPFATRWVLTGKLEHSAGAAMGPTS